MILGPLGGTLVQTNIGCYLCLILNNLSKVIEIHRQWLPLLGLAAHRKDQAVLPGQLFPTLALKAVSKCPKGPQDLLPPASTYLPICYLLGSVTERGSGIIKRLELVDL